MKNKFSLLLIIFVASLFVADISFAGREEDGAGECSESIWADECQEFIHKRDHINNIKQLPRYRKYEFYDCLEDMGGYDFGKGNRCKTVLDYPNLRYDY